MSATRLTRAERERLDAVYEANLHRYELTAGQLRVARILRTGQSNKEIADRLGISEHTIKQHLSLVYQRLGVLDRIQAVLTLYGMYP